MPSANFMSADDEATNANWTRLDLALQAKAASLPITPHTWTPGTPPLTPVVGLTYTSQEVMNQNWIVFDTLLGGGTVSAAKTVRFTPDQAQNHNIRRAITTLAGLAITVPVGLLDG